jgi:hypothetical protein
MTVSAIWHATGRFDSSPGHRPFAGLRSPAPGRGALKEDLSVRTVLPIERYKIKLNNTVYRYLELYCYLEL